MRSKQLGAPPVGEVHGLASYLHLWRTPGMASLVTGFTLARLPTGMVALALTLSTLQQNGSIATAGAVSASYAIAMALSMPAIGRAVDRRGPRLVLLVTGPLYPLTLLLFSCVVTGLLPTSTLALVGCAAAAGACLPPVAPIVRSTWAQDLDEVATRAANGLESLLVNTFYVVGPAVVGLLAGWRLAWVALVASAALNATGVALVSGNQRARLLPRTAHAVHRLAALRQPGMGLVLALSLAYTVSGAAMEFNVIGWSHDRQQTGLAGVVLAVAAIGSIVASLGYGVGVRWLETMSLPACFGLWTASLVILGVATTLDAQPTLVVAAAILVEAAGTPMLPLLVNRVRDVASPHLRTESFSWRMSALMVGMSAGAAVCGVAVSWFGALGSASIGVLVGVLGTLVAAAHVGSELADANPRAAELPPSEPADVSARTRRIVSTGSGRRWGACSDRSRPAGGKRSRTT